MFCPSCHTRNQNFNNYCYYCGYKLKDSNDSDISDDSDISINNNREDQDPKYKLNIKSYDIIQEEQENNEPVQDNTSPDIDLNFDEHFDEHLDKNAALYTNNSLYDDLFTDNDSSTLDLNTQIPLRRYHKDETYSNKSKKYLKILLSTLTLALAVLAILILMNKFISGTPQKTDLSQSIAVSYSVKEMTKDGEKAYRVVFNTVNGKEITFAGNSLDVVNGRADFIVEEELLYSYSPQLNEDGLYEVIVDAIISAPNLPDSTEKVSIPLVSPNYAPFTLLQPSTSETKFEGDNSKVAFMIEPDSKLVINGEDLSDLITDEGRFEKEFTLSPQEEELVLNIRVSTPGCMDNIQEIVLKKSTMDVPITIDNSIPIVSDEQWIKISGITKPEASLEADLDVFEEPKIDKETGAFEIYVKADYSGYTPCTLTAKLDNDKSSIEVILERKTNVDTYTSTAWEPDYNKLQQDIELNNGRHFVVSGTIKDIIETGDKTVFTLSPYEEAELEQLFYVEYWGSFDYSLGDNIRVFGNRWGNKDNLPRILAKYIYD